MDREPKISEIEKLINHFRETGREDELLDVLREHSIKSDEIIPVLDEGTNEFHEEAIVINEIAVREGFLKKTNRFWYALKEAYRKKWYVRYGVYYLMLFSLTFIILNAPIFLSRINLKEDKKAPKIITTQELENIPMADSAPLDPGEVVPAGSQIVLPKIGAKAPILYVGTRDEKTVQANLSNGVVHYAGTAKPGEVGNAFITGHSSNFWWVKGQYNYIFVNLDKMEIGDQATIYQNGKKFVYQVTEKKIVVPEDLSVLAPTDTPTLTLMTCTPPGTNWKRLIVKLDQVAPKYEKPKMVEKQVVLNEETGNLPGADGNLGSVVAKLWQGTKKLFSF